MEDNIKHNTIKSLILSFITPYILVQPSSGTLARKTGWNVLASIASLIGRLGTIIILARLLGPTGMGQVAYMIWIAEIIRMLTNLGLPSGISRYLAELYGQGQTEQAKGLIKWAFQRNLGLVLLGITLLGLIGGFDEDLDSLTPWLILSMLFLFNGFGDLYQAHLTGLQRFDLRAKINLISSVFLIAGISIGVYFFGWQGALGGYIAGAAVPGVLGFLVLIRRIPTAPLPKKLVQQVWKYSIYTGMAFVVSSFAWSRTEIFFLEYYWNAEQVGLFTASLSLATLFSMGPLMFLGALMPHFAELKGAKDLAGIRHTYARATRLTAVGLFPLCLGGAVIIPVLMPLLYGKAFIPAIPSAIVMVTFSMFTLINVGNALLLGLEKANFFFLSSMIGAVVALLAYIILIPSWGIWGAVWARFITQSTVFILVVWYIAQRLTFLLPVWTLCKTLLAAILCALAAYMPVTYLPTPYVLVLSIPLGAVVYIFFLKVLHVLEPSDIKAFQKPLRHLPIFLKTRILALLCWVTGNT
jgi:O-antigen/teichoic acid export membrane protein